MATARASTGPEETDPTESASGDPRGFSRVDLDVLRDIIELNGLDESSSALDENDGDGVLDPHELGSQEWRDGHLVGLYLGPNRDFSFGYKDPTAA